MSTTSKPIALLSWSLDVHCPKCDEHFDMAGHDVDGEHDIARHIFSNQWDKLKGWEVTCPLCEHEFTIEKVDY